MTQKIKEKAPKVDTRSAGIVFIHNDIFYQALKSSLSGMIHAVSSITKKIEYISRDTVTTVFTPEESATMFDKFI